jgi:hypothetical protein
MIFHLCQNFVVKFISLVPVKYMDPDLVCEMAPNTCVCFTTSRTCWRKQSEVIIWLLRLRDLKHSPLSCSAFVTDFTGAESCNLTRVK